MALGKLKMKLAPLLNKKFTFYEYARHTLASSSNFVSSTMGDVNKNSQMNHVIYYQTKNFYIQLLATYSASHIYYPFFNQLVPLDYLTESLQEMVRGRDVGIRAWTFDNNPIDDELVERYSVCFKRYYQGIMKDCDSLDQADDSAYNPDINTFTKLFLEDSIFLLENESHISINEIDRTYLSHTVADIPLTVFTNLSNKSVVYIP